MKLCRVSLLYLAMASCAGFAAPCAAELTLPTLMAVLGDGPIRVKSSVALRSGVSAETARETARRSIGIAFGAAWPVLFTDQENLTGMLRKRSCWLLRSVHPVLLTVRCKTPRTAFLFTAVDAQTGLIWEAFTAPTDPWWQRETLKNADLVKSLGAGIPAITQGRYDKSTDGGGYLQAEPATVPPRVSLDGVFRFAAGNTSSGQPHGLLDIPYVGAATTGAQQVIVRYLVFTDYGSRTLINTKTGQKEKLTTDHQPVWWIFVEGLHAPFTGPRPFSAHPQPMPNVEEGYCLYNAVTGKLIESGGYR